MLAKITAALAKVDAADEIDRLHDLSAALMAHLDQLPIKHPQQGEHRNELRRQFDAIVGKQIGDQQ